MIQVVLNADPKRGKIFIEKSDAGGGNVEFLGGSFWVKEFPSDVKEGIYVQVVFEGNLFRGQVTPRGIVSVIPDTETK